MNRNNEECYFRRLKLIIYDEKDLNWIKQNFDGGSDQRW